MKCKIRFYRNFFTRIPDGAVIACKGEASFYASIGDSLDKIRLESRGRRVPSAVKAQAKRALIRKLKADRAWRLRWRRKDYKQSYWP